jgi:peroxiredoxin
VGPRLLAGLSVCAALVAATTGCRAAPRGGIPLDPEHPTLAIGSPAPDFALPGVDGRTHSLADYASAHALAVVFACNHCPASQLYEGRLRQLYEDYRSKGVALVAINPDSPKAVRLDELGYTDVADSLDAMKIRAAHRHIEYPYLYDGDTQTVAAKFGAAGTPQIFVFDRERKLRYQGQIDDNPREDLVKARHARRAIDALLAGTPVAVAQTATLGCPTSWLSRRSRVDEETAKINAEPVTLTMAGPAALKTLRGNGTGKLLLVNFWATWCGPCVSEFPDLQDTYRMYRGRGLNLVTVSSNDPDEKPAVLAFLQKFHSSSSNLQFGTHDTYGLQAAFDPMMGAGVPFTVLIAPNGDVLYQEEGALDMLKLRRAILANLPDDAAHAGEHAYWSGN